MSRLSVWMFARVQSAEFYRRVHDEAVALLPSGNGQVWLDLGCGPGLVARLAASHGYRAMGLDRDAQMVATARRIAHARGIDAHFETRDLSDAASKLAQADVVSAASLLFVLDDARERLQWILRAMRSGAVLLIVETSTRMRPREALRWMRRHGIRRGGAWLLLWAIFRNGRACDIGTWIAAPWRAVRTPLLDGMVDAWVIAIPRDAPTA